MNETPTPNHERVNARSPRLIVSLHDVAPPFESDIQAQIAELDRIGIDRFVLKVVPCWHGMYPISRTPSISRLLGQRIDRGCQLVLHGFEHRPSGAWRGSRSRRLRARLFASSAAEFMTLDATQACAAIESGLGELDAAGLPRPDWFCAPGWLMPDDLEGALLRSHILFLSGMFSVRDLRTKRMFRMPSRGYMGVSGVQEAGIAVMNAVTSVVVPRTAAAKIYLHPDPSGRRRWSKALEQVERLVRQGWLPSTFEDLVRDQRKWTVKGESETPRVTADCPARTRKPSDHET